MRIPLRKDAYLHEVSGPELARIVRPIGSDLQRVQVHLAATFADARDPAVRQIVDFLLETPGKRLRPALVLLSARAARGPDNGCVKFHETCTRAAVAVELIHMASLVHDDLIDAAALRHDRASVPARWGRRVAVFVGDYLCAIAFRQVADCADPRLFAILGTPLSVMCEGELLQVASRGDFHLSERYCLAVVERKTAALFGACCAAGALAAAREATLRQALQRFGFHCGIAFQVLDDCRDLLGAYEDLGKVPGQDWRAGDVTLPLLYAIRHFRRCGGSPWETNRPALGQRELARLGQAFRASPAPARIVRLIKSHIGRAKRALQVVADSVFKDGLGQLADHIAESASRILVR
jgi:geranylgeranyl pyrophosphate synthase